MKSLRLLSLCLIGSALTLSACTKSDDSEETTSSTLGNNDTSNDDADDDTTGASDFGDAGDAGTTDAGDGDGDGTTTGSDDAGFLPPEGDLESVASCDPWTQDCPEGEKCVAYASGGASWDANRCVAVGGDGQAGDPCTYTGAAESLDDCGVDSWCWDVDAEGAGTCTPFCTGSPDEPVCGPGSSCSIANEGSINLCLLACNPLLQDCPIDGTSCFYDGGSFVCANATQDIPAGEACGFINDCIGGTICLAPESFPNCNAASCCGEFCDIADPTCTIDGTECTVFFEEGTAPPGYEDVGVCIVPG